VHNARSEACVARLRIWRWAAGPCGNAGQNRDGPPVPAIAALGSEENVAYSLIRAAHRIAEEMPDILLFIVKDWLGNTHCGYHS